MSSLTLSNTFLVVVIALILIRMMYRRIKQGLNGRPFKTFRLFTTPVIYFKVGWIQKFQQYSCQKSCNPDSKYIWRSGTAGLLPALSVPACPVPVLSGSVNMRLN